MKTTVTEIERLAIEQGMIKREFQVGDLVRCVDNDSIVNHGLGWVKDLEFKITKVSRFDGKECCYGGWQGHGVYTQYLELVTNKETDMKTVKKSELGKIHQVACSGWKTKIEAIANRNIFDDTVEVTQNEIDAMFAASDVKQTAVLVSVFGIQTKEIDLYRDTVDGKQLFIRSGSDKDCLIAVRMGGAYRNKAFYLNSKYDWEFKAECSGGYILIPTRK